MDKWSHLPNAIHISYVMNNIAYHPEGWEYASNTSYPIFKPLLERDLTNAWRAGMNVLGKDKDLFDLFQSLRFKDIEEFLAEYTIMALMAYPDYSHLLYASTDELRVLHALGDKHAIYFIFSSIAFKYNSTHA